MLRIVFIIFFVLTFGAMAQGQDVPKPVGFVNDFTSTPKALTEEQRLELETMLQKYKEKTAIEFAVAIEDTHFGKGEFNRSLEYSRAWKVGSKEIDHGLLLYIAIKDRRYHMQVSQHLEEDLTDGRAGQIQRENLVPHFQRAEFSHEEYFLGIKATIQAVIDYLGDTPMVERERLRAERAKIEQQQREKEERDAVERWRKFKAAMPYVLPPLLTLSFFFSVFYLLRKHRRLVAETQEKLRNTIGRIDNPMRVAKRRSRVIPKQMAALVKRAPNHDWTKLQARVDGLPVLLSQLDRRVVAVKEIPTEFLSDLQKALVEAQRILIQAQQAASLLADINGEISNLRTARRNSRSLIDTLPTRFARVKVRLTLPNVPVKAKDKVSDAIVKFDRAKQMAKQASVDWIEVRTVLMRVEELLASAEAHIQDSQRPKTVVRSNRSFRRSSGGSYTGSSRKSDDTGFNFTFTPTTTIGSGSTGGGGFEGFGGGGSFSGGGAGGGW